MISLAVKYRPKTFDDVVEQGAIKQILSEQITSATHQNAYLFTGGAGTGKTTCARIFANEINRGMGNPIEIDAASNNGVDNIREIIDSAKFKSLDSQFKVYIIDECHMLSTGAWNAMLKLLEEPPARTLFLLCTTDPQKIPATILSRVQRYDFQRITYKSIVNRLEYILKAEGEELDPEMNHAVDVIPYDMESLEYIAKLADGGMRDAITLLDKCLSFSKEINIQNVITALGTVDYGTMFDLTDAILDMKADQATIIIEEAYRSGIDLKQFMKQYSYFILDSYKYFLLGGFEYLQLPSTYGEKLKAYEQDQEFLKFLLDAIIRLNSEIKWEMVPKPLIESTIILLCKEEV